MNEMNRLKLPNDVETETIKQYTRKKRGRKPLPNDLPRVVVEYKLEDYQRRCQNQGSSWNLTRECCRLMATKLMIKLEKQKMFDMFIVGRIISVMCYNTYPKELDV